MTAKTQSIKLVKVALSPVRLFLWPKLQLSQGDTLNGMVGTLAQDEARTLSCRFDVFLQVTQVDVIPNRKRAGTCLFVV